jgi:aspartate racemase
MKTIGLLGGSSDQATADYYRLLNTAANARLGGWNTAELLISSMNFATAVRYVREAAWDEAGQDLSRRARALESAGAAVLICVSNTLHRVADIFTADLKIPFIHIADPTAEAILKAGLKRVALLGTKPVMSTEFMKRRYEENWGVEVVVPSDTDQDSVDCAIFDELCKGQFLNETRAAFLEIIHRLRADGAEGVILGCTEIPLLVSQADCPDMPVFNTAALHCEAAIDMAVGLTALQQAES